MARTTSRSSRSHAGDGIASAWHTAIAVSRVRRAALLGPPAAPFGSVRRVTDARGRMAGTEILDLSAGRTFAGGFPHDFFAWLRREHPVWWHEPTASTPDGEGFWVVSRHADAVVIMRDPTTFASGAGGTAIGDSPGAGLMLNQTDDPQHWRLRSLVSRGFTTRTIGRMEDDLRSRVGQILDAVPVGEPF